MKVLVEHKSTVRSWRFLISSWRWACCQAGDYPQTEDFRCQIRAHRWGVDKGSVMRRDVVASRVRAS